MSEGQELVGVSLLVVVPSHTGDSPVLGILEGKVPNRRKRWILSTSIMASVEGTETGVCPCVVFPALFAWL